MQISYIENQEYQDFLKEKLRNFNNENSKYHRESRQGGYFKFVELKEEANDTFAAGAVARMYWNMMFIDTVFVEESCRKLGLGKKLIATLIGIAKENHCKFIILETYSFQAKDFYAKYGFKVVGVIEDYPPGEAFFTMRLDLNV